MNRARITAVATAAVVVLGGSGVVAACSSTNSVTTTSIAASSAAPTATNSPAETPTLPPKAIDPLTGREVNHRGVIAAKVENIAAARPQVGLSQADITFIQEVEGAQTRLIAVYHSRFPKRLGPIRSARSTDVQLLPLFGRPGLVYSNASVQPKVDRASIVPIQRSTRDRTRAAPHNVFVDLAAIAQSRKLLAATSIGWTFDDAVPRASQATSVKVRVGRDSFSFGYSSGRYVVRWNGTSYADGDSGTITKTDNVVIMSVRNHPDGNRDVLGAPSVESDTVGEGTVIIYRNGTKIVGQWKRAKVSAPLRFTDKSGESIALKPGQTWVALAG
jgi:Protein of unknown function (DUF3048) N-terminal domain/Protein of unknown function (DUF3048) C-terminal domain